MPNKSQVWMDTQKLIWIDTQWSVTHIIELLNFVDVNGERTYYGTNQLLGFLPPTKEVPHTCKIVNYF